MSINYDNSIILITSKIVKQTNPTTDIILKYLGGLSKNFGLFRSFIMSNKTNVKYRNIPSGMMLSRKPPIC